MPHVGHGGEGGKRILETGNGCAEEVALAVLARDPPWEEFGERDPVHARNGAERSRAAFATAGGHHAVTVELPEDLPRAMADARRIAQVPGNLSANAARHFPESAPIRVAAGSRRRCW